MISIIYGCLETAREFTCSKSCLASSSPIRTVCPCFPSLYVSTTPPPTPRFLFFLHTPFVAQCACLLLCSCSRFDAPVYLSAASALLTGCACPHASSQRFLVDVAILVQLWHRRLTSTLARMCCLTTSLPSLPGCPPTLAGIFGRWRCHESEKYVVLFKLIGIFFVVALS